MGDFSDFDDEYFRRRELSENLRFQAHEYDFRFVAKIIEKNESSVPRQMKILDVGCAEGNFSRKFNRFGLVEGVEPNALIRSKAGLNLSRVHESLPLCQFDLVLLRGVLQHIPNGAEFWEWVGHYLRPGGYLALLANPNGRSPMYLRTNSLPALRVSDSFSSNFHIYSTREIKYQFKKYNINCISVKFPYLGTPYARPFGDLKSGIASLLSGKPNERPFPRNMFNMVGQRRFN